jgi:hypothetical protein
MWLIIPASQNWSRHVGIHSSPRLARSKYTFQNRRQPIPTTTKYVHYDNDERNNVQLSRSTKTTTINMIKGKAVPQHNYGGAWGERIYSSYSFTSSALDGIEWSVSRPGRALQLGKGPPVPTLQVAGWAPEPVWTKTLEEKSSCYCRGSNLDRPVIQSVARLYTDWDTLAPIKDNTQFSCQLLNQGNRRRKTKYEHSSFWSVKSVSCNIWFWYVTFNTLSNIISTNRWEFQEL